MKAYIKPETQIFSINTDRQLLAGSDVAVGNAFGSGDEVLSRHQDGSIWDDDEEDNNDYNL